jgi:hypothetical protein
VITDEEKARLVAAWRTAPDSSSDPRVQEMVRAEVGRIQRAFEVLRRKIEVRFVDTDPYSTYQELRQDVIVNKRMLVWTGASETPLWTPEVNWKARAVHDWDHVTHDVDFSMEGEHAAYRVAAEKTPGLAPLYLSEIVLQAAVQTFTGQFDEQKLVLPSDTTVKLIDSLRGPETQQRASMLVWLAAGWLDFMKPAELMVHLRAMGVDEASSIVVADAAMMLRDRRL